MYHGWHGGGWGLEGQALGFPWGGIAMAVLFLALIALLIIAIVRLGKIRKTDIQGSKERGIDILIERYARGEISRAEFEDMRRDVQA